MVLVCEAKLEAQGFDCHVRRPLQNLLCIIHLERCKGAACRHLEEIVASAFKGRTAHACLTAEKRNVWHSAYVLSEHGENFMKARFLLVVGEDISVKQFVFAVPDDFPENRLRQVIYDIEVPALETLAFLDDYV